MADIKVTQDDREAAAKCHERSCYEIIRIQAVQCRNGYADGDYLVQTFARHRIEAEQRGAKKMRDAAVEWLRGYAEEMEEFHSVAPGFLRGAADQIATFNFAEELD